MELHNLTKEILKNLVGLAIFLNQHFRGNKIGQVSGKFP